MAEILVLYYSRGGSVARLARQLARGVEEVPGMQARLRTVPPVAAVTQQAAPPVPEDGAPYVQASDLDECAGLALGSPTRFGNMAAPMKHFIDGLGAQWASGTLAGIQPVRSGAGFAVSAVLGVACSPMPSAAMALHHAPMVTDGSPFSMRCSVTSDRPAASAVTVALSRSALRWARICAPKA